MFASIVLRNNNVALRQLIHRIKPIYCKHPENASITSKFSTAIRGGNMQQSSKDVSTSESKAYGTQQQSKNLTNFEKRILVYNKNFPTMADVPDSVSISVLNKAKDWSRVRISIWMIGATILGCVIVAYSGREAAKRGDGVQKRNLEWHKQYNEQARKADAEAKAVADAKAEAAVEAEAAAAAQKSS